MEQNLEHQSIGDMGAGKGRWKPSDDQLRVLMKLFEEEVGTINKQRIKEITAELSQQGHITEANVHNWFHNRKARAKRKQVSVQRDGESEVDTDVESSKGKRPKSEQDEENLENGKVFLSSHCNGVSPDMKLSFKEVQQSDPSDVLVQEAEYRKPIKFVSSSLNLKSRVSESPTPAECRIVKLKAEETSQQGNTQEYYKLTGRSQDPEHLMRRSDPDMTPDAWRMNLYSSKQPYRAGNEYQNHDLSTTDSVERTSDSKTITDDASTESEDIEEEVNKSKSWTKEGMTMIGRRQREQKRTNRRENADRRDRIRNILNNMRTSSDTYDRDLKALFIEIVNRLGIATARSILDGFTPDVRTPQNLNLRSSPCQSTSSASCSSTPSLPSEKSRSSLSHSPSHQAGHKRMQTHTSNYTIRIVQRPNPSSSDIVPKHKAKSRKNAALQKLDHSLSCPTLNQRSRGMACQDHAKNWEASPQHGPEVSPLFRGKTHQAIGSRDPSTGSDEPFTTGPVLHSAPCRLDIDIDPPTSDKDDYRIVWSDKNREREMEDYEKEDNILEVKDPYRRDDVLSRSERRERLAKLRMDGSDCDRTTVTVVDGKPIGANGSWWNSLLRYSALLFLDISIPHIALQPEDGIAKIREYMDTKFDYNGGPIDDNYLKKQIARSLNFKRHKVMRLIEQGGKRPEDVSEDQWDALTRYWSDPRRREKSERQRAALKALSINGGVHGEARQIESTQSN